MAYIIGGGKALLTLLFFFFFFLKTTFNDILHVHFFCSRKEVCDWPSYLHVHFFLCIMDMQKLIFEETEDGVRKVVLATNIAETSITVDDVVFVLDCGKAKETSYDALNNTPCLLPTWISKASAHQVML